MEEYKNNKVKHVAGLIGWLIIMSAYLVQYFHIYRLYILAAASIYLFCVEIISGKRNNKEEKEVSLSESLERWLGITSLVFLGYFAVSYCPYISYAELLKSFFVNIKFVLGAIMSIKANLLLVIFILTIVVLAVTKKVPTENKLAELFHPYIKYMAIFFLIFYGITGGFALSMLFVALGCAFFGIDIIQRKKYFIIRGKASKWYIWLGSLCLLVLTLEPRLISQLRVFGYLDYHIFVKILQFKNIFLISMVLIALAVICRMIEKEKILQDEFILMMVASLLWVIGVLYKYYVGYWWIILSIYLSFSVGYMLHIDNYEKKWIYSKFLLIPLATILFTIGANNGKVVSMSLLYVSLFFINYVVKKQAKEEDKIVYIMLAILAGIATFAFGRIFEVRNFVQNYVVLISAFLLFAGIVFLMSYNPGIFMIKEKKIIGGCTAVIVMFAVLCLAISVKAGNSVKIKTDGNQVNIITEAHGKNNFVKNKEVFWLNDYIETIIVQGEKNLPKDMPVTENKSYNLSRSGRIKVIATDKNGVKTTAVKWYHICGYKG